MTTPFWQGKKWVGVHPPKVPRQHGQLAAEPFRPCDPVDWSPYVVPVTNQNGPSCAGWGKARDKSMRLRKYHPDGLKVFRPGEHINGDAIHAEARRMFYNGDMDGGLYIPEAFAAALEMGIYAPGSELKTIPRSEAMYSPLFGLYPFIDGRDVSGWINHGVADNGQVYEFGEMDGTGGHCTVDAVRINQDGRNYWMDPTEWGKAFGRDGLFLMSQDEDEIEGMENHKYYVIEPPGWEQHDGWRKWVVGR